MAKISMRNAEKIQRHSTIIINQTWQTQNSWGIVQVDKRRSETHETPYSQNKNNEIICPRMTAAWSLPGRSRWNGMNWKEIKALKYG